MSGIAGIIHFNGAPVAEGLIEGMTTAMAYRGPDGIHHWRKGSVALGQCMLHTTPESLEEHQPLSNEDESLVLVMDGRVDNWIELRQELLAKDANLRDRSDAELVLRAYETWGPECLPHIDGDFAFVIWNARRQEAFCARDRMGNKPFNYHWDGKTLAFASEVHPILALAWVPEELDEGMVAEYLALEWHSKDATFWRGINRLPPAHSMTAGAAGPRAQVYWSPDFSKEVRYTRDEQYIEHYRSLFTDIVRRMSRSFAPVACEVSGGLDSSAIFAVAEHLRQQESLLAPSLDGYTLDFQGDRDADEMAYARAVGAHCGRNIHEIAPTRQPLTWYREQAERYREFPGYPNGIMSIGLREAVRESGSRALLVGVGGDEWLGGDRMYYAEALAAREWPRLLRLLRKDVKGIGYTRSIYHLFRHGLYPFVPSAIRRSMRRIIGAVSTDAPDASAQLAPELRLLLNSKRAATAAVPPANLKRHGQKRQFQIFSDAYSVRAREAEERMSACLGIELRLPFHHYQMIQFSFGTPERLRLSGRFNKFLHRQAMTGLLPDPVLLRESKADFMTTFRGQIPELLEMLKDRQYSMRLAWLEPEGLMAAQRERYDDLDGSREWELWSLFGCAMIK